MASETVDEAEQTISIKEYLNEVEEEELVISFSCIPIQGFVR